MAPEESEESGVGSTGGSEHTDFVSEIIHRLAGRGGGYGRYTLKGEVARGGQGAILRVWDEDLRRHLAMKVTLAQTQEKTGDTQAIDSRTLGRFLEEAQVTGQLDHPGIVPVHELGLDDQGQVYFTMKLVKGRDLRAIFELVRDGQEGWTQTRALNVLLRVCEAMAYAHSKGVIHRDLKPGNIMVGKFGAVYVMDWGLARVMGEDDRKDIRLRPAPSLSVSEIKSDRSDGTDAESPLVTMDGDVVGTPSYMSPEQARGDLSAMGPASDVYSVGAILYHLLCGHLPYGPRGAWLNGHAIWAMVQNGPPAELHTVTQGASEELIAICEKAMAREITERYSDMGAMAEDLQAYVEGRVVKAYRTGVVVELAKWVRRNRPLAASILIALLLAAGGLGATSYVQTRARGRLAEQNALLEKARATAVANADRASEQAERAKASQAQAEDAEREARESEEAGRRQLYVTDMQLAPFLWKDKQTTAAHMAARLEAHDPTRSANSDGKEDLRGFEWYYHNYLVESGSTVYPHDADVLDVALTDDGRVITLDRTGRLRFWSADTHLASDSPASTEAGEVRLGAISSDGGRAAVVTGDALRLIDTHTGAETRIPELGGPDVQSLALSDDGGLLVLLRKRELHWIDTRTGRFIASSGQGQELRLPEDGRSMTLSLSADCRTVAVGPMGSVGQFCLILGWDARDQVEFVSRINRGSTIGLFALSPDGSSLAVGSTFTRELAVYDTATGRALCSNSSEHTSAVTAMSFSRDGSWLATGDEEGTIVAWTNPRNLDPHRTLKGHGRFIARLRIEDGLLVSSSDEGNVRRWDLNRPSRGARSFGAEALMDATFSPDGLLVATVRGYRVLLQDAFTAEPVRVLAEGDGRIYSLALSPDHRMLAVGRESPVQARTVTLWDIDSGQRVAELGGIVATGGWVLAYNAPDALAFTPDGRHLVAGFGHRLYQYFPAGLPILKIFEVATGRGFQPRDDPGAGCVSIAFSGDGRRMVTCSHDGSARIWETETWSVLHRLALPGVRSFQGVSISRDGRLLAGASLAKTISLWDTETGLLLETLEGHTAGVNCVAFSSDGRTLASGGADGTVRLWSVRPASALMTLTPGGFDLGSIIDSVGFSPDGSQLCASGQASAVVWSAGRSAWEDPERAARSLADLLESKAEFRSRIRMLSEQPRLQEALAILASRTGAGDTGAGEVTAALAAARANQEAVHGRWSAATAQLDRLSQSSQGKAAEWFRTPGLLRLALALVYEGRAREASSLLTGGAERRRLDGLPDIRTPAGDAQLTALLQQVEAELEGGEGAAALLELRAEIAGQWSGFQAQIADYSAAIKRLSRQPTDEFEGDLARLHRRRGDAYLANEDWVQAADDYRQVADAGAADGALLVDLARAEEKIGDWEFAALTLGWAAEEFGSGSELLRFGRRALDSDRREVAEEMLGEAQRHYERARRKDPRDPSLAGTLAEVMLARAAEPAWAVLRPIEMTSTGGAELSLQADGSILASGSTPYDDVYTVTFSLPPGGLRALRLEALPHAAIPNQGPLWSRSSFRAQLRILIDGVPLELEDAVVSNTEEGLAHRSSERGDWINWGSPEALFALGRSTESASRLTLQVAENGPILGCFRLSSSSDPRQFERAKKLLAAKHLSGPRTPWSKLAAVYWLLEDSSAIESLEGLGPHVAAQIGDLWAADRQWDRAIRLYDRALAELPTDGALLARRGSAHIGAGRWDQAEADWLRAVEEHPRLLAAGLDQLILSGAWSVAVRLAWLLAEQEPVSSYGWGPQQAHVASLGLWLKLGALLVLSGDGAGYREFCQRVTERFAGIEDASVADAITRACLLVPGAIDLDQLPVPTGPPRNYLDACTRALFALRGDDAVLAREQALEAEGYEGKPTAVFLASAILILAELELGHRDEARHQAELVMADPLFSKTDYTAPEHLAHQALFAEVWARLDE